MIPGKGKEENREIFLVSGGKVGYNGGRKQVRDMVIGIIGGGASGMAAALEAARNPDNRVYLLERQARLGRKLQATGNGRCNLSNREMDLTHYHGDTPDFAAAALDRFDVAQTIRWMEELGLYAVTEPSGRIYPYSDQANSVLDVLRFGLEKPNLTVMTGTEVTRIRRDGEDFLLDHGDGSLRCQRVIVACGGLAGGKLGGSMAGYQLLRRLGHSVTRLRPNLVQLKSDWNGTTSLKGVRANARVRIFQEAFLWAESTGELQFTEYGLSGPVIFEISRDVCQGSGDWTARLDFLPDWTGDRLLEALRKRRATPLPVDELLTGILHNRLGRVLTKAAGLRGGAPISDLTEEELGAAVQAVKDFSVSLTEPLGMDAAQVTAGGVRTAEFDPDTMESRLVPGLFACGEVLDIDGDCGGYNLQWAWSSGRLAGESAGRERP